MNNLLVNWKTTSAGIVAIVGAITTLVYAIIDHNLTPAIITTVTTALVGGIGLIVAKDGNK